MKSEEALCGVVTLIKLSPGVKQRSTDHHEPVDQHGPAPITASS